MPPDDRPDPTTGAGACEERLRAMVNSTPAILWTADPAGNITFHNPRWLEYTGIDPADNVSDWPRRVLHPDDLERCVAAWADALRTGREYQIEVRNRRHDGEYRWFLTRATPARDPAGRILEWYGSTTDIHDQKVAERRLRASEERFRAALHASPVVVFNQDRNLRYTWIHNPALGYSADEVLGRTDTGLLERAEEAERLNSIKRAVLADGVARRQEVVIQQAGVSRTYDLTVQPQQDVTGAVVGLTCSAVDITDRKRAEERQAFLLRLTDALRPLADPDQVQNTACRLLGERLGVDRAYFVEVREAEGVARVRGNHLRGDSPSLVGDHRVADFGWVIPLMRRGEVVVMTDATTSPLIPSAERSPMAAVRIAAHITAPLVKGGELVGALCVTEPGPRAWTPDEVELVRETGERIWAAAERAKAEAELRYSRAFHELIAGLGSDWWFQARIEPDGTAVTELLSEGFTRRLGYTRDELMAAGGWGVVVHPDDRPEAERQMKRLLAGETIEGELRHVARDGGVNWSHYRTRPEVDPTGRVVRVQGVARDVSDRKRAEAALRESEERFRGLAEAVPQVVWSSTDETVDYYNSRWWAYTGLDPASGLGEAWHAVVHPADRERVVRASAESARTGHEYEVEYRLRRHDGVYRWHIARAVRVRSLGRWFGVATDVHDLKTTAAELRERDEQLTLAQRAAGIGVSSLDLATGVGVTTPEWRAVVGMPDPPAPQDFPTFLGQVHPDDRGQVAALHAAPPPADGLEFEFRVNHPTRGERWVLSRSRVVPAADGPGRLVGIALDVTERKRAEEGRRASLELARAVAANLPNAAAFVVDSDLRYVLAAGEALTAAGFSSAQLEGRSIGEALEPRLVPSYTANYRQALAGVPFRTEHESHARHYVTHGAPLRDASGRITSALAVSYDITDRVRAEQGLRQAHATLELRVADRTAELASTLEVLMTEMEARRDAQEARHELLGRLVSAQEEERRRIARELHDSLGQYLAAMNLELTAARRVAVQSETRDRLGRLSELTAETGREVHRLALELRPTALDDVGLPAAVQHYVEVWSARTGVPAEFDSRGLDAERFQWQVSTAVYRVVQEALTNVVRHARASRVSVLVERHADHLFAVVEDDGVGFDPDGVLAAPPLGSGLGLLGMRERVALVRGSLQIESAVGTGTAVYVRIPVPAREGGEHE